MSINTETLNRRLYKVLARYKPKPLDANGDTTDVEDEADVFKFEFTKDGESYGTVFATIDNNHKLNLYYDDEVTESPSVPTTGLDYNDTWEGLTTYLKQWAMRNQLSWNPDNNKDHLVHDMARRKHMKKKEQVAEGYYPMGKKSSYSDSVPSVKIVIEHTRQIEEGEQRYRNVNRIFLENEQGERILAPTVRPGIARIYARHIAEGGLPHDDRWNHIKGLCEEYNKMAGFVRATRGGQFNESAQKLVETGINHYNSLRESLSKMAGHRGYNMYFESWTPPLMEDDTDTSNINELFVQETLDPRIESVMPILSKLHKTVAEMKEVDALAEWADSLLEGGDGGEAGDDAEKGIQMGDIAGEAEEDLTEAPGAETLAHDDRTEASNLKAFDLEEGDGGQEALNPIGIPEGEDHNPVASAITRRILSQRLDLVKKYGPVAITQAIEDVADFVGDVEEIGSSDVSGWIKQVEQSLGGVHEGIIDKIKDVGQKALNTLGHGSDDELLKDLKKRAGVRNSENGKPSMAHSDVEKVDEVDMGQYDAVKSSPKGSNDDDVFKNFREKLKQYGDELDQRQKEKSEEVDESALQAYLGDKKYGEDGMDALRKAGREHAGKEKMQNIRAKFSNKEKDVAEDLDANQKRVGQLGPTEKVKNNNIGKLVGANENFINTDAQAVVTEKTKVKEGNEDLQAMLRIINR